MSETNGSAHPTCGTCRHWQRLPADPGDLSRPAAGECRQGPPQALMASTPRGLAQVAAHYPVTPAEFPACGQHDRRESLLRP